METNTWETIYILMSCFNKDLGHPACESLIYFYDALCNILINPRQRKLLCLYLKKNPIDKQIHCDVKDDKMRLTWAVNLRNFVEIDKAPDNIEEVILKYNPLKITKKFWGNAIWKFIHYTCIYQPKILNEDQKHYIKQMITSLSFLLPCAICRNHLKENLHEFPITGYLTTNEKIFEWSSILHNRVNKSIGKPVMSLQEAKKMFMTSPYHLF